MGVRVVQHSYGGPSVLTIESADPPPLSPGAVLVRVRAASLNPVDSKSRQGLGRTPLALGPFPISVGWDAAGVVEGIGAGVVDFSVGDRVFGLANFPFIGGALGTYVVAPEDQWALSPRSLDDVHASAVPLAALTALTALRTVAAVQPGHRVLVHAAGGGVGHFAVQLAQHLGADVVATASPDKHDLLQELGIHHVIDHKSTDFVVALADEPVDVVVDLVGGDVGVRSVGVLRPGGVLVCVPAGVDDTTSSAAAAAGVRAEAMFVRPDGRALAELADWIDSGRIVVHVSRVFDLADVQAAHHALDTGRTAGKIVVRIPGS